MNVSPAGDRALLIGLGPVSADELHAAAAAVRAKKGVLACIPGQQSLYVIFETAPFPIDLEKSGRFVRSASKPHTLEVSFHPTHALDLDEFLSRAAVTRDAFLARIRDLRLTARYLGFRAGFAYLDGWPEEWAMPRRPTSRPVPRGSFAIANAVAGFYPIDSPGGWNVLGRTAVALWDARRDPPNLIRAGDSVRIVPIEERIDPPAATEAVPLQIDGVEIVRNAQFTTVAGVPDWSRVDQGLSPGGPFDAELAAAANRAVGNRGDAPILECALAGPRLRFRDRRVVVWAGAGSNLPQWQPIAVGRDEEIDVGPIRGAMRGYLAIGTEEEGGRLVRSFDAKRIVTIAGPHETSLGTIECEVTPQLNRVGIRLRPLRPIAIEAPPDLPSCGMQFGTIQLHPDGSLVAMGPDHPITGGYLQVMTVRWDERWKLGVLRPGDRVMLEQ